VICLNIDVYGFYKRYQNARDTAWQTLIDFKAHELPVPLADICGSLGITLLDDSHAHELRPTESGIAVKQGSKWYIIFDDSDTRGKQRFTVAHELGHILMGHALKNGYYTRRDNIAKPADETEADMYAARLLAPACVLWGINACTAEQIAAICDISLTAAKYRAERMSLLRSRNKFLVSPLEREVYENFREYIENHKII
jgi:hypothetical protein